MTAMLPQQEEDTRKAIPIFGLGQQQRSPFISTVKRVNCVVEMTENGRQQAAIIGLPGLEEFVNLGTPPCRIMFSVDESYVLFTVVGDQILRVQMNGTNTLIGTFTTDTGPVWMASSGKELLINDGQTAFIYNLVTGVLAQIVDPDFPVGARGAVFLQARFWVYTPQGSGANEGRVYGSDQLNGMAWDGLNFFIPEALPDGIRGMTRWFNDLVVFGIHSIEWWSGAPTPLVGALGFRPITGANTEVGLGAELGFDGIEQLLLFVGHGSGRAGIYKIQGYSAIKISPPWVDDELEKRSTRFASVCTSYMVGGHPIFQVTIPGTYEENALTIIYDTLTELWSLRTSHARPYYRGLFAASTRDAIYISDAFVGLIYRMLDSSYGEGIDIMPFEVTSVHLLKEGDFLSVDEIQVDMETGVGVVSGQGDDPKGMIQVSKDGGRTWGDERWVSIGKIGKYKTRAVRRRIGQSRDIAIRFRITDPVPRRIVGAYLRLSAGDA